MSKHNYTQYANKNTEYEQPNAAAVEITEVDNVVVTDTPVASEVATCETCGQQYEPEQGHECTAVVQTTAVTGTVVKCTKLNVRTEPNITAKVVSELNVKTEVTIDIDESTDEWFKVCTAAGVEGYCMKKFIDTNL